MSSRPRLVEEHSFESRTRALVDDACRGDLAAGGDVCAGCELIDSGLGFEAFVADGEVIEEAAEVGQAELGERGGAAGADGGELGEGGRKGECRGGH
jgi:hypothetical protein